jgi:hypothetical protein
MLEIVGKNLNFIAERMAAFRMVGQRANLVPAIEQQPRRIFARIAERSRDYDRLVWHRLALFLAISVFSEFIPTPAPKIELQ